MTPSNSLIANKWYPLQRTPLYPTPHSILRNAVGAADYKFTSETVNTDFVRAAVVMPRDVPIQHLQQAAPWCMTYYHPDWCMVIASVVDPMRWLELARASGAVAWLKAHNQTYTYNWEMPPVDEHGLKIRPPNALGVSVAAPVAADPTKKRRIRTAPTKQQKDYDRAELLRDLAVRELTVKAIAEKHNLSKIRVYEISKAAGLLKTRKPVHEST